MLHCTILVNTEVCCILYTCLTHLINLKCSHNDVKEHNSYAGVRGWAGKQDKKCLEQIKNVLKYAVKTLIFCYQAILLLTSL